MKRIICKIILFFVSLEIFFQVGTLVNLFILDFQISERLSRNKDVNKMRVMCIGGSLTALGGEYSYPRILERYLNDRQSKIHFEVINKGAAAYTTVQQLSVLEKYLAQYDPDIIVSMMGLSDVEYYEKEVPDTKLLRLKLLVLDRIKTYRLLKQCRGYLKDWIYRIKTQGLSGIQPSKEDLHVISTQHSEEPPVEEPVGENWEFDPKAMVGNKELFYKRLHNPHPLTIRVYNDFAEKIIRQRKKLIVMQYPLTDISGLKNALALKDKIIFVSNAQFSEALKDAQYEDYFVDAVGGYFGHFTPKGANLVSENLSNIIFKELGILQ